jgi:hypothetical protein
MSFSTVNFSKLTAILNNFKEASFLKIAKSLELEKLIEAKKRSDRSDYEGKHKVLADLLRKYPSNFKVDSEVNNKYVGITHKPSGFKIHAPRKIIPENIENTINKKS